jgi:hypothetical protein
MEAMLHFETSDITRATRHNISEDRILRSYLLEKLKPYIALTGGAL